MRNFLCLLKRELQTCFLSPMAFVVIFFFWVLLGLNFWWMLTQLAVGQPLLMASQLMFGGPIVLVLPIVIPLITMRLFAEERKLGTLESMLTAPITTGELVLAKFAGALAFYVVLWLPVFFQACVEHVLAPSAGTVFPDYGALRAGTVGILLVGGVYIAVGLLMSSFTANQIVAAISSAAILFTFLLTTAYMASTAQNPTVRILGQYYSSYIHMLDFARGIVDSRFIVHYVAYTAWFLFVAAKVVEARRP